MVLDFLKSLFGNKTNDNETKVFYDSKLGKLTCEFDRKKDEFFFWNAILTNINNDKSETTITIEGDVNCPNSGLLDSAYKIIDNLNSITADVQNGLNSKYPEKSIDLSKGYVLDDISFYTDDEVEYEMEFTSDDQEMVSVSFKNNLITELDLY
ncbi:hypothetical protein FSS13T_16730 [Flavobacterium saliperosum S13]|uniref:DUF2262 domain-containing protein n=2 Tax=Flavobacterium saliperosum TaxID=329186 RepID=A0A1G4VI19_9FLAO|nr:hypothetical protein [Flavobacterium saliperosum]ESU25440.1 hypothetical protein FSS13T_16730 [Flavobacterium saliperosum S13]SCX07133.1 hypothetical protein SAMN02927925_01115 [Flavobacterium saliperosum]